MATDLFAKNASLVDTSAASRIAQNTNAANNPVKVNVSPTEQQFNDYRDAVTTYWTAEETERQWNNAISKQKNQRQSIIDLYNQFYTSGSYYDANGKLVTDQNPYDYADRLQFAEYLHSLYPELSVDYFMQNAEAFMEEATGVKGDISSYSQHIGNIWDATWASTGLAIKTFGNYIYYGLNGGFGTQEWENKKQELAQDRATSGANYRKDLGDEKYDSLIQKMISGTVEQSPQIAMMLGQMALTAATGGFAGALSAGYLINDATAKGVLKAGQWAGRAANFAFSALTEAGNSMLDCYQNGFSDEASTLVGLATGAFTGMLETWGDDQLLKPLNDAVEAVVGLNDGKVMKEAVQSFGQWCADHAVKTAKNVGASLVTEPAEEEVELLAGTLIENIAASVERLHGRDVTGGKDWNEFWTEAKDTLVQTLLSTPLMTLAGGAAGTGIEILGGNGSMQWTPSAYMNREGATSVIANGNIVSDTIKQSKTKTDTKGKADPIKAHTIGNQVFIDEELSPKQYEAIKNKKAVYITDTEASKLITTPRAQLDNDAITVDATLTANEAQNFLSKAEEDGKLKGYGFATEEGAISRTLKKAKGDNGLSEQNGGDATILYMEIEGVDNPIKIQIEEEEKDSKTDTKYEPETTELQTEEVDEDPFAELQNITGIKYKEFETLTARSEKIRKKRQQEAQKKKQDKKQAKKDTKAASTTENTTQTAQTTTQQTTEAKPQTDIIAEIEAQKAAKNQPEQQATTAPQATTDTQQKADTTKKYDVKKAEFPSKYLRENSNTPIEVAEYLDKDGNILPEGTKGEYLALTDPNGNTKVVNVKDVKESTLNKILSNAKNSGVDKNTANKTYAKEKNASKKQAQTTVGITPDEGKSVQTVSQKEESDKRTIASKAEKAKNAGSVYNIKTFFPNMGVTDADGVPVRGASDLDYQFKGTYELVNENGETVVDLNEAKAFIGTDVDGKEYVFKMGELNKEDFEYFVDEAIQIKTAPTEAANTVTEQQYTKKVNEVQKDSGTDRDTAENAVLATVSVKNALEQQGVKLSLDDAVNKLKEKGAIKNFENAKNLTQSVRAISETLFAMDGADSVLSELFDEQGVTEKITPKTFAKLFHAYLRNDENIDFTENQMLFFEELKDGLLAQYENTSTTLTSEQQQEKKAIEEGDGVMLQMIGRKGAERLLKNKIFAPLENLKEAERMESIGYSAEEIWETTKWYRGVDGQWKMELRDSFKGLNFKSRKDLLRNFKLNKEYPLSKFVDKTILLAEPLINTFSLKFYNEKGTGTVGYCSYQDWCIYINTHYIKDSEDVKKTLVHEIQHIIQASEDFALGTNDEAISSTQNNIELEIEERRKSVEKAMRPLLGAQSFLEVLRNYVETKKEEGFGYEYLSVKEYIDYWLKGAEKLKIDGYFGLDSFSGFSKNGTEITNEEISQMEAHLYKQIQNLKKDDRLTELYQLYNDIYLGDPNMIYFLYAGESEARNSEERYAENLYDEFPLATQDALSRDQIVVRANLKAGTPPTLELGQKPKSTLAYQDSANEIQNDINATRVETEKISSPFKYNKDTQQYFFDSVGAYNNIREVMIAENGGDLSNIEQIENDAKLGAIFLSSLAPDVQDKIIKRSIDSSKQSKDLNNGAKSNLLRLFFSADEYTGEIGDTSRMKGASLTRSAKILLTEHSDESTVVHEVGHVAWHVDPSFRDRAKTEYGKYFQEDENGVGIRTVVEASPDRFGGMTADEVVEALKYLAGIDIVNPNDFEIDSEDYFWAVDKEKKLKKNAEEAVMYMFEAYRDGRDTVEYSKGIKGLFERLAQFIKDVADKIKEHYGVDILHTTNTAIYSPLFENESDYREYSEDTANVVVNYIDSILHTSRNNQAVRRLVISEDGNTEIWEGGDSLIITHSLSETNLLKQLEDDGKMPAISLAVKKPDTTTFVSSGSITLVGDAKMAQRVAENGELYNGDIYSAMYPETYQETLSKNFFDKLEEKVRSIEGIDDSTLERLLNEVDILRNLIKGEGFSREDVETLRNSRNFIDIFRAIEGIGKADKAEYMPKNYDSSAFEKFGKGFEDYYFDTLVDIYKENNGKFFPAAVAHRLRAVVTAELYPEIASFLDISDIDAVNNYYEDMPLDDQMKVDSALHDIRMGSDIFSKFENAVRSYYRASGEWKNPKDLLESIRYEARRTYLMNGKEATAENVQEEVNSKRVKNAAPIGTETEYRVLALKKLLSLSEVHENENRLNNEAGDFGNSKQTTEFKTLFYNEEKELGYAVLAYGNGNIGSEIKQKNSGYDVLKFALDTLNKTSPQGDVEQLERPLGEYLANNYNIPLERRDLVVSMVTSSIQKLWTNAAKMDAPYFEAKKREILNISDFKIAFVGNWASEGIIKALEAKGLKVFVYDDSLFLQDGWKEELGKLVKKATSSIEGDAEQVMFQTMGEVVDGLKSEKDKDYTESQIRFEEQVYKYINSKVDFSNSFIDQWRAKNLDTFVDDNALQDLQNQLQNSGLFEVIDNQLNLSEQTANYIKKHVTERIAYEGEDYVTFADKIGEKLKKLSNRDGYVREYTDAVKDALYLLYGYRADVPNKKKQNNKRATGIFSKSFMNGGARVGVAMDSLTKKFMSAKKVLEEKGMKFTLTEKDIKTFLNPAEWKANAKDGTQLFKYGSDMSASGLEFKLAEKGLSTQKLAEFLSLMVSQTEDGYIPIAWRENDEAGISPVQGPLIDALNYAHKTDTGTLTSKTPKGFSQNSYNDAEEGYLTAAYNKFAERNIPLTEGTLSSSAILLDQYKADYLSAIEVLNGKEGMNDIFGKEINVDAIEQMKKEAGERITTTREQVAEVEEINELFQKEILTERGLLQQLGDIITSIENDSKNGISISKESFQRLSDLIKQIGEKKDNKSTARINSLDAKLTAQKKSAAEKREAQKAAFDKKLEKVNKENKDKIENIKKKNDEKIQKLNEKNDKKEKRLNERIENLILKNKVLTDARETVRQKANALFKSVFDPEHNAKIGGVDKDTATAVEHVLDLLKDLRKENENLVKEKEQLAAETTAINERLKSKLGIEVATAKDFDNAGVLPIFRAGVKELRSVAANSGTAEIRERLGNILDAFTNPSNLGTDLYIGEIFNGQDLYSSTNTKNYLKYKNDFDELRTWLYDNMGARKGPMNVITIVKTINQLNTRQLAEFIDHVNKVSKDSKNYFAEITEKENQYYDTWEDTIVSEIEQFAKLKGKDISQLTDEDALGTKGAKDVLSGGVGKLLSEFALQSVKYRDRFPTLYAYIFGGLDHEGKVYGGLNGAANAVDENFRKDVDDINKLVISKLSGTQFVKGELTDKNLRRKWNEVKNYFKTQLGEAEFDDDAKQKIGYRIDTFRDSEGILRYEVEVDEKSDSAMKQVAKYLGKQEIQKRRTQDKLKSLMKSITKTQDRILTNEDTIGRAESDIEYWKKAKVWVSGAKFGMPVTEEDRKAQIKRLTERVASVTDTLQRNREVLERKEEKVPILKERIAAFDKIGKRPNENMAKYTTQELLSIYMYAKQEGGIDRLVYSPTQEGNAASSNTNNLDIGNIIWVIKQFEENEEYAPLRELADGLSVIASRNFEAVRKTKFFLSNGQVLLDPIEHYFSFVADTSEMYNFGQEVDLGGFDKPAEGKTTKDSRRAKASDVMTQEREPNVVRGLNLSVLDRAYSSMYQQEYYISMGEKIESLKRLLSNDKFQTAFKDYYGRNKGVQNLKSLGKYVNSLSNTQRDFDNSAVSGIVRFFTNNTAVGAMAFSLPTVLQQIPTMLWCLKDPHIGLKGVLTALHRATTDKSLYGLSPQMQERANSAIQSIRATKNLGSAFSAKFNNYTIEQAITMTQDAGLWLLEKADNYIANAMWYATFEGVRSEYEALDDNNAKKQQFLALSADEQEQLIANEATQRVLDISPVQGGKDNAAAYSTSNAYIRQLLLFTNQTTKMLNGIVGGFRDIDVKGKTYLARILAVSIATLMLNGIINGKMWRKTKDDDDDEAEINLLKNIPYALWEGGIELIPLLDSLMSNDRYGETSIPSDLENIMTVFKKAPDKRTENQMMNAWANLLTDIMSTSGLAGNQARRVYRAFRDKNILQAYNSKYGELAN